MQEVGCAGPDFKKGYVQLVQECPKVVKDASQKSEINRWEVGHGDGKI